MIKRLFACLAIASMAFTPTGAFQAATIAKDSIPDLPSAFGYEPKDEDERGLWLQMDEFERKIKYSKLLIDDPDLNAYLRKVLCNTVGKNRCASTRIYLMRTPFFNASMAPNGMMMVWSGLLLRVRSEAELASVLAHEFGHFENQHSLQSFRDIRAKTDAMAWFSLVPGVGSFAQFELVGSVFRFNRDMEREADIVAVNYMAENGYDPVAASTIWEQLRGEMDATAKARKQKSRKDSDGGFFAPHPNSKERMDYLRDAASKMDAKKFRKGEADYRAAIKDWWPRLIDDQGREAAGPGVGGVPGLLVLEVQDADLAPVPELGKVEPDVLQQVVVDRQAVPVGEERLQECLVGAPPEHFGLIQRLDEPMSKFQSMGMYSNTFPTASVLASLQN